MYTHICTYIYINTPYVYISIQRFKDLQGFRVALLAGEHLKHQVEGVHVMYMCACIYIYTYLRIYIYKNKYIYKHIYIHIHTYIYI